MTALRLISLPVHGALEMLVGFLVMVAPIALGLSAPAAVIGIVIGTLLVGLALAAVDVEAEGRRPLPIATHHSIDYGLVTGMLGAAVILGVAGDRAAAVLFAAAALLQLSLNLTTRYSHR
ncbi:MAG: hypothetical protein JWM73_1689 [Solirubrobacterales bacterium]|jgi:hypothetical protein|nr:hypothetical protein [Solirubrobacterales bacterium]